MGLCLICVFLLTLLLLADIKICFLVMTCVLFTMVAVTGGLYFWNQVQLIESVLHSQTKMSRTLDTRAGGSHHYNLWFTLKRI